ncbi:hypothetical protein SmJEL517_g01443 [Synchytrium microbalum]|uniref:Amino acid permease/ SLC12A domain-containing protein n=1 Tax=Synchytrium microbalum TaxID=1806994 RepID=A0A507CAI2_9FUNG|nr:uncharacterized protein SmJEL517_g01443 [Synchytrium microbalum]TPX36179.1 hypothetical protein SmJEL517_g01443 [Synchytrium microbalum]
MSATFDFGTSLAIPLSLSVNRPELSQVVSLKNGLALVIGQMIGSGVFASPGPVFKHSGSVGMSLIVWILSGFLAMTGSLCYAELGTALPTSGGEFPYLLRAFGSLPSFLFAWTGTLVTRPGSVAIISTVFGDYVGRLIYFGSPHGSAPDWVAKLAAMICVTLLTGINCLSVKIGLRVMDYSTVTKLLGILLIGVVGLASIGKFKDAADANAADIFVGTTSDFGQLSLAMYSALWAYDGWNNLNLVTGELVNPTRNLPRCLIFGPIIVLISYLLANIGYYSVLPSTVVQNSTTIAMDFGHSVFGTAGGIVIPLIVLASTMGASNASIIGGARVSFVAARSGHLPHGLAMIHQTRRTPVTALLAQMALSLLFILVGNYSSLVNFYSMIAWTFYLFAVLALLELRRREPELDRPFRVWLSAPIIFCGVVVFLIGCSILEAPTEAAAAFFFLLSGVPFWYIVVKRDVSWDELASYLLCPPSPLIYIISSLVDKIRGRRRQPQPQSSTVSSAWFAASNLVFRNSSEYHKAPDDNGDDELDFGGLLDDEDDDGVDIFADEYDLDHEMAELNSSSK